MISLVLYAVFQTFYKKFGALDDDPAPVFNGIRMLGYIGVQTLLLFWPVLIITHFTGIERFKLPTLKIFYHILAVVLLSIGIDAGFIICLIVSTPLFTS